MILTIRNQQGQPVPFNITDRPTEVKTTSIGAPSGFIPPMSTLSFNFFEGEVIVLSHDGTILVLKEAFDA